MVEKTILINNPAGLHSRPAALFVQIAGKYVSEIWLKKGDKRVNAKSIMGLMSLAASQGSEVVLEVNGEDEKLAIKELGELIQNGLGEK